MTTENRTAGMWVWLIIRATIVGVAFLLIAPLDLQPFLAALIVGVIAFVLFGPWATSIVARGAAKDR